MSDTRRRSRVSGFEIWDDTKITPGSNWSAEIERALAGCRVAVLLVSPEFLASDYVIQVELPAILRRAGSDLTVLWIPLRASAFDATALKNYQAAYDPARPIANLPRPKQDEALVTISKKIAAAVDVNAVANALKIIDDFEPQANAFLAGGLEPEKPVAHSWRAEQVEASIKLVEPSGSRQLITAAQLELDQNAQKLIRAYERTMKDLFERWTELKPKRYAVDAETRREAREESDEVRKELCHELNGLLGFIESMGMSLKDHYVHVRYICSQQVV
jgi:TIR domain